MKKLEKIKTGVKQLASQKALLGYVLYLNSVTLQPPSDFINRVFNRFRSVQPSPAVARFHRVI